MRSAAILIAWATLAVDAVANSGPTEAEVHSEFFAATDQLIDELWPLLGPQGEASARNIVGHAYEGLSLLDLAEPQFDRARLRSTRYGLVQQGLAATAQLAQIAFVRGDYKRSIQLLEANIDAAREARDLGRELLAQMGLGNVLRRIDRLDEAVVHYEAAMDLAMLLDDEAMQAQGLANLSIVFRTQGDFVVALENQLEAIAILNRLGETSQHDRLLLHIGLLHRDLEDFQQARENLEAALAAADVSGNLNSRAAIIGSLAQLANDEAQPLRALEYAAEVRALNQRSGSESGRVFDSIEFGRAYLQLGRVDEARSEFEQALRIARAIGQHRSEGDVLFQLAQLAERTGDLEAAAEALEQSRIVAQAAKDRPRLLANFVATERVLAALGDSAAALSFAQQRYQLREELLGLQSARRLAQLEGRNRRLDQERQIELLTKDNELKQTRLELQVRVRLLGTALLAMLLILLMFVASRFYVARRMNQKLQRRNEEIVRQREALAEANNLLELKTQALFVASITDPLTGLPNRRRAMDLLESAMADCRDRGMPLAVALIDLDHFKRINDQLGHIVGDRALKAAARSMAERLDSTQTLGRFGGEEFVLIIPARTTAEVDELLETLRRSLTEVRSDDQGPLPALSASFGVSNYVPGQPLSTQAFLAQADQALYAAKEAGRNRVRWFVAEPGVVVADQRRH